ncbi:MULTISPECIES: HPr(Ser) kinase/phosphatase [unclassified Gemella]|uniref:HPr(Ser) kinase/phosphatase n=1 Tax=unclassified Gemella TaxID=2624949 RepID=UPI001C04A0B6|nr:MULTISPECIES: HPr(Ser) kinase/phosphatase [unclassified Gemella]MBU0278057.1 HPr(Ser) kinase/phosphatase [Gemella sp. zg-1178]QWQ38414.1 HPr(Ser) kinase/phosphatase [Gemella sp. zg-570]
MGRVVTKDIIEKLNLEVITGETCLDREIESADISRPSLELAGYFSYYNPTRVQVLGETELSFFNLLSEKEKKARMRMLCTRKTPCIIISRSLDVPEALLEAAIRYGTPILRSDMPTTRIIAKLTYILSREFAPEISVHGVFIEVYGIGVLITGESGIGKSEIALELIKRGHRLIADDRVDIKELDNGFLIGRCGSPIIKNLLEIRGLGIINVMTLFGTGAVREDKVVNLNIHLESWDKSKNYDRLGLYNEYRLIHNTKVEKKVIPVSPGRNVAIIIESAAMNFRLNKMGINTSQEFANRLKDEIKNKKGD